MPISVGGTTLSSLAVGGTYIKKVYVGTTEVFNSSGGDVASITISGTITDSVNNATIASPLTYSVTGNAGSSVSFTKTITPSNNYAHGTYTENSSIWSMSRSGNTLTFTYTIPDSQTSDITNNFTVDGAAFIPTYTATLSVTDNVIGASNSTVSSDLSDTGAEGDAYSLFYYRTPNTDYEWSGTAPSNIVHNGTFVDSDVSFSATYSGTIAAKQYSGSISITSSDSNVTVSGVSPSSYSNLTVGQTVDVDYTITAASGREFSDGTTSKDLSVTLTVPSGGGTLSYQDTNATVVSERTVTLSATNNISGAGFTISDTTVTGAIGSTHDETITVTTTQNDAYFTTFPSISGNDNFTVISTSDDTPIYSDDSNNYLRRRVLTIRVTIPSDDVTDTFTIEGATATVKSVTWDDTMPNVPYTSGTFSLGFRSTDPDGEPPSVTETVTWISDVSVESYSGGIGTVTGSVSENTLQSNRDGVLTLSSSTDSGTADATLTQAAAPAPAIATTGSLPADTTWSFSPDSSDLYAITVTTNGSWQSNVTQLPAGWTATDIGSDSANGTIRISKPAGDNNLTGVIRIGLFPSDSLDLSDRLDLMALNYEVEA